MAARVYKLIGIFLIVGLTLYIVLLNRETVTIRLGPSFQLTALAGVIYLAIFALGISCAALVGVFVGVKAWFRERKLINLDKQRREFYEGALAARSYTASAEWRKAAEMWEFLIRKDPTDMIARVELSRCLQGRGDTREALKVLESARVAAPDNVEVLFRAAEIHTALGNKTAAIDNLALILSSRPNLKAASMARDLSEDLHRFADALEYQSQLESLAAPDQAIEAARARIEFRQLVAELGEESAELEKQLRTFIRKYPRCAPALARLAAFEAAQGETEKAAQLLIKASQVGNDQHSRLEATRLWLKDQRPDRAIAAARSAARDTTGRARLESEFDIVRLYISLNMLDDARQSLDGFEALARKEGVDPDRQIWFEYYTLRGLCLSRLGEHQKSAEIWQKLCDYDFELKDSVLERKTASAVLPPALTLSTP